MTRSKESNGLPNFSECLWEVAGKWDIGFPEYDKILRYMGDKIFNAAKEGAWVCEFTAAEIPLSHAGWDQMKQSGPPGHESLDCLCFLRGVYQLQNESAHFKANICDGGEDSEDLLVISWFGEFPEWAQIPPQ